MTKERTLETYEINWQGIRIEIHYYPSYWQAYENVYGYGLSHIEIKSIEPKDAPLPISETGYRSYWIPQPVIAEHGDIVKQVQAWLDEAAHSPKWKAQATAARQLSLF